MRSIVNSYNNTHNMHSTEYINQHPVHAVGMGRTNSSGGACNGWGPWDETSKTKSYDYPTD